MRKTILVKGPALSRSGYGEQARFALRALRTREDVLDIYIVNIPWGQTGLIVEESEERAWIDQTINKTQVYVQNQGTFDLSLQITIPNEFEKIAPYNVGYTAGIETTRLLPSRNTPKKYLKTLNMMSATAKPAKRSRAGDSRFLWKLLTTLSVRKNPRK